MLNEFNGHGLELLRLHVISLINGSHEVTKEGNDELVDAIGRWMLSTDLGWITDEYLTKTFHLDSITAGGLVVSLLNSNRFVVDGRLLNGSRNRTLIAINVIKERYY